MKKESIRQLADKTKNKQIVYLAEKAGSFLKFSEYLKPKKHYLFFSPLFIVLIFAISYAAEAPSFAHNSKNKLAVGKDTARESVLEKTLFVDVDPAKSKGIYLTMWTASRESRMEELTKLIDETDINSVVIDVKGSQGELIYEIYPKIGALIKELHKKNIYTIARVVIFQDSGYAALHPEFVLKTAKGNLWRDRRGFAWLDPASQGSWDHIVDVSEKAIDLGFDEIQFDYVRFPTDGNLDAIVYPAWDGQKTRDEVLNEFFAYSIKKIKEYDSRINVSIDIFGYTFLRGDGLGIGQVLSDAVDYFDYISPMVYPSHYGEGNFGFQNPAEHPYEVIFKTMEQGLNSLREETYQKYLAENLSIEESGKLADDYVIKVKTKIRPWIQVFDMGARYDSVKIKAQIQAIYDSGLTGWLMWDPNNRYNDVKDAISSESK